MSTSAAPTESFEALQTQLAELRRRSELAEAKVKSLQYQLVATKLNAQRYYTRLSALMKNLRVGLMLVDDNGMVELVNPRYCEMFGLPDTAGSRQLSGMAVAAQIQDCFLDPAAYVQRAAAVRLAGRTVLNEELHLADGRVMERDYLVLDNAMAGRLVCYRDVTQRYHREAQLRAVSLISEQSPNPILRLTTAGELAYANPAAKPLVYALTGTRPAAQWDQLRDLVTTSLHTAQPQKLEISIARRHFLVTVAPMPAEGYATLYLVDITGRRQAEEQLSEQQKFYETILNELPADIGVVDTQHRYLFVNHAGIRNPEARAWIIGKTHTEYCTHRQRPMEYAERRERLFDQVIRERQPVTFEETVTGRSGPHYLLRRLQPVFHPDGSVRLILAYGLDITERYLAEQKLAEQRRFYEDILNHLSADISVLDAQHRYVFVNPVSIKNTQVREWIIGKDDFEYCAYRQRPRELAEERRQRFDLAVQQRTEVQWEEALNTEAGPRHILRRLCPIFTPDGTLRMVVGLGLDITDRYLAEERQRMSEALVNEQQEFIRQVVDTSPNFLYVTDELGQPIFTNASFEEITGRSLHRQATLAEDTPEAAELRLLDGWHAEVLATRRDITAEMPFTLANGEVLQFQVVKRPLLRPHGVLEVLTVGTDITELKRARREAEAAVRARENFLANMSHEIRTPMNGVLGMAGLLARTALNPQQQEYLSVIQHSGTHLLGVLNDVLDVAKITSGKLELEQIPFDLNQTLQTVGQTAAFQAASKGIAFSIDLLDRPQPLILSDPQRLRQVLLNLLSNSLKFTERGAISLAGKLLSESATTLTVSFLVRDTGLGVALDKQETIFSTFSQAYADTTRRFGGTGLGLSISSNLVEQLGGHLVLCSEPDQGSSFGFTLSFLKAPAGTAPTPPHAALVPTALDVEAVRGLRVLLVEDHEVNRQLAQLVLESYAVQVSTAADGPAALVLFEQQPFDIVLMDIQMPGMSGLEATALLRRHPDPHRARTPVIALTANAFRADNEHYLAAGLDDCLAKPFDPAELLHKMLQLHQAHSAAPPAPLFELTELHRMAHGSAEFVERILTSFLTHTPPALEQLEQATQLADWEQVTRLAHKLKPSLKLLGVQSLLAPVALLTAAAAAPERAAAAAELLRILPQVVAQLREELRPAPAE